MTETADIRFECPFCKQSIEAPSHGAEEVTNCPTCGVRIKVPHKTLDDLPATSFQQGPPLLINDEPAVRCVRCVHCKDEMHEAIHGKRTYIRQLVGLSLLFGGLGMMAGGLDNGMVILGLILFIGSFGLLSRVKIWRCPHCGYFFERAT